LFVRPCPVDGRVDLADAALPVTEPTDLNMVDRGLPGDLVATDGRGFCFRGVAPVGVVDGLLAGFHPPSRGVDLGALPHALVVARGLGVLWVSDDVGDLLDRDRAHAHAAGVGVGEEHKEDLAIGLELALLLLARLVAGQLGLVLLVVEEGLHHIVNPVVGGLDRHALAPDVEHLDGDTALDQRVFERHEPRHLYDPQSCSGAELAAIVAQALVADILQRKLQLGQALGQLLDRKGLRLDDAVKIGGGGRVTHSVLMRMPSSSSSSGSSDCHWVGSSRRLTPPAPASTWSSFLPWGKDSSSSKNARCQSPATRSTSWAWQQAASGSARLTLSPCTGSARATTPSSSSSRMMVSQASLASPGGCSM